jgi:hypothetical protein
MQSKKATTSILDNKTMEGENGKKETMQSAYFASK